MMSRKPVILYVDDEPINLILFEKNFEKKYVVITASSGESGLEVLENTEQIDVVISDMKMPGMNGLEFISKAKEKYPELKYYILTGFDISSEIGTALKEKVILKYFRKPFNLMEIASEIDHRLSD